MTVPQAGAGAIAGSTSAPPESVPGLDPSIKFDWPSTVFGMGACRAAKYTGNFSCTLDTVLPDTIEGSVTIVLTESSETQLLPIAPGQGQLMAFDRGTRTILIAPVTGVLDCSKQLLTAQVAPTKSEMLPLDRQVAWFIDINNSQPLVGVNLKGSLDASEQTIDGDLTLRFDPAPSCAGTFKLRASP